jgi:hypothetical protein
MSALSHELFVSSVIKTDCRQHLAAHSLFAISTSNGLTRHPRPSGRLATHRSGSTRFFDLVVIETDDVAQDLSISMPENVFSYRFDWDEQPKFLWSDLGELLGAAHGFEIPFVFGHWDLGPNSDRLFVEENRAGREKLSHAMMSYWAEFAAQGRPGKGRDGNLPDWTPWTADAPRFAILDTYADGGVRMTEGLDTPERIVETILADESYETLGNRCMAIASIYNWAPLAFSVRDYQSAGNGLCERFAIRDLVDPL